MKGRVEEEKRLTALAEKTLVEFDIYANNVFQYLELLREFDSICDDGIFTSICSLNDENCECVICNLQQ